MKFYYRYLKFLFINTICRDMIKRNVFSTYVYIATLLKAKRFKSGISYKNVDIKFSVHDLFLE